MLQELLAIQEKSEHKKGDPWVNAVHLRFSDLFDGIA